MRKLLLILSSGFLLALFGSVASSANEAGNVVKITGHGIFDRNELVAETLHFGPGQIWVSSGTRVTWVKADASSDPHTITIVNKSDRPNSFDEVFACGSNPTDVCSSALAAHFPGGFNNPPVIRVEPDSVPGLDQPGDSLLLCPNFNPQAQACGHGSISAVVSAPAGSTLFYMCVIHPWMQGVIHVT